MFCRDNWSIESEKVAWALEMLHQLPINFYQTNKTDTWTWSKNIQFKLLFFAPICPKKFILLLIEWHSTETGIFFNNFSAHWH